MSSFLDCCFQKLLTEDKSLKDLENLNKLGGKERILKLSYQENFPENIKYFQINDDKNIYETETFHDTFNLNFQNSFFDFSNKCLFCEGENCKSEKYNEKNKSAIKGLNSEIFFNCVYASQRPSTSLIKKYNIIKQFKNNKIKLIINCQIQGEHPKCGPINGLESISGYSYSPSVFIEEDIDYLNFGFPEDSCPLTLDFMLEIVKKISYIIKYKKGKVLVHGHSADGRCCLVIACFAIFYFNLKADDALLKIRKKIYSAINNNIQEEFCKKFEIYIHMLKNIFPMKPIPIYNFIKYQNDISIESDDLDEISVPSIIASFFKDSQIDKFKLSEIVNIKYIPHIIVKCLDKIIILKNKYKLNNDDLYLVLNGLNNITQNDYNQISLIKKELKKNIWDLFDKTENLLIITEILFNWLNSHVINCINPRNLNKLYEKSLNNEKKINDILKENYKLTQMELNDLISSFKIILSKTEIEIIKYIAIFISFIYPKADKDKQINPEEIKEFKRFLYKLSLFLLGYNLDKVNALSDKNNSKEILAAKNFIFVLEFFLFYYTEETKIKKKENESNDWLNEYLNIKKEFEDYENQNNNSDDILLFFESKPEINFESIKSFL